MRFAAASGLRCRAPGELATRLDQTTEGLNLEDEAGVEDDRLRSGFHDAATRPCRRVPRSPRRRGKSAV